MNFGIVTKFYDCPEGNLAKKLKETIDLEHNSFIYNRNNINNKEWIVEQVTDNVEDKINEETLLNFIRNNIIQCIIWINETDSKMIKVCESNGVKSIKVNPKTFKEEKFNTLMEEAILEFESKEVKELKKILRKTKPFKIAHLSLFAPNASGLYESSKEMVHGETILGINAGMVNLLQDNLRIPYGKYQDHGIITKPMSWCLDADMFVIHYTITKELQDLNTPTLFINHGEPNFCYQSQMYHDKPKKFDLTIDSETHQTIKINNTIEVKAKKDVSYTVTLPGIKTYFQIMHYMKDKHITRCVTLWKEHMQYFDAVGYKHRNKFTPAPVDLSEFYINKEIREKRSDKDTFNIIFSDMWRFTKDPFIIVHAFRLFLEKVPNSKLYIFGKSKEYDEFWNRYIKELDIADKININGISKNLPLIYNLMDCLVTTKAITTRTISESMSSGLPVIGGGFKLTPYNGYFEDPQSYCDAMYKCYLDIQKYGKEYMSNKFRDIANKHHNFVNTAYGMIDIYKDISYYYRANSNVNIVEEDPKKDKVTFVYNNLNIYIDNIVKDFQLNKYRVRKISPKLISEIEQDSKYVIFFDLDNVSKEDLINLRKNKKIKTIFWNINKLKSSNGLEFDRVFSFDDEFTLPKEYLNKPIKEYDIVTFKYMEDDYKEIIKELKNNNIRIKEFMLDKIKRDEVYEIIHKSKFVLNKNPAVNRYDIFNHGSLCLETTHLNNGLYYENVDNIKQIMEKYSDKKEYNNKVKELRNETIKEHTPTKVFFKMLKRS